MRTMENLEYSFVLRELKSAEGRHFSNAYLISEGKYRIKIGDVQIILEAGKRINIAKYMEDAAEPDNIVNSMKKNLDNAKLKSITQHHGDRVIIFEFESSPDATLVVFEGFGNGNIILVKDGKTLVAMREESWSDREIRRNRPYSPPKSSIIPKFEDAITEVKNKYVIIALLKLPLGKEYAKEILARCAIDEKTPAVELKKAEIEKIKSEIEKLKSEVRPVAFYENNQIVDYGLCAFSKYSKLQIQARQFPRLSDTVDEFYFNIKSEKSEKLEKLERRLEEQKSRLESMTREMGELKAKTDYIYQNYDKIEQLLKEKSKERKKKEIEVEF